MIALLDDQPESVREGVRLGGREVGGGQRPGDGVRVEHQVGFSHDRRGRGHPADARIGEDVTDTAIAGTSTPAGLDTLTPDARARVGSALADARSPNTRRTYRAQWQRFAAWCERHGRAGLPASPATVADYLTNRATAAKTATVRLSAAAIGAAHRAAGQPDPTATPIVRDSMRGIARQHAAHPDAAPRQAAALTYDDAIRLMATAERPQPAGRGVESAEHAAERARLDAAFVALLFCAGLRRSEVSALRWADVAAVRDQVGLDESWSRIPPIAEGAYRHAAPQAVQSGAPASALTGRHGARRRQRRSIVAALTARSRSRTAGSRLRWP